MGDAITDANPIWERLVNMVDGLPPYVSSFIWHFALILLFLAMLAFALILLDKIPYHLTRNRGLISVGVLRFAEKAPLIGRTVGGFLVRMAVPNPKPLTKRQRAVRVAGIFVYCVVFLGLSWLLYGPNMIVRGLETNSGGILIEVKARR